MRAFDRDLIRGGHYGQRPRVPRWKAEHMAAPTNVANEESSCQLGAVHTWPLEDICLRCSDCPLKEAKRTRHFAAQMSANDPKRTLGNRPPPQSISDVIA
jgi:hypothetical protein